MKISNFFSLSLQKKIGLLISILGFSATILNIITGFANGFSVRKIFISEQVTLVFLVSLLFFLSYRFESFFFKLFQVFSLYIQTILNFIDNMLDQSPFYESFYAYAFFFISLILAFKYKFFQKNFLFRISLFFLPFLTIIGYWRIYFDSSPNTIVSDIIFTSFFLLTLFIIYSDDIKAYIKTNRELQNFIDSQYAYIDFGKRYATLSHNFKSTVTGIGGAIDVTKTIVDNLKQNYSDYNDAKITQQLMTLDNIIKIQERSLNMLIDSITSVSTILKTTQNTEVKMLEINETLRDFISILKLYPEAHKIDITFEEGPKIYIDIRPSDLVQIFNNITTNSLEALWSYPIDNPYLHIKISKNKNIAAILFTDNGPGFSFLPQNSEQDYTDSEVFSVGKTTKKNGTGQGMVYVRNKIRDYNGKIIISNRNGATIQLELPISKYAKNNL